MILSSTTSSLPQDCTTNPTQSSLPTPSPPSLIITASTPQMGSPTLPSHHQSNQSTSQSSQSQSQVQPMVPTITNIDKPSPKLPSLSRTRAASQSVSLSRPPSLIQLTEAMRLNPNRWQQLKLETNSIKAASSTSSAPPLPAEQSPVSATITPITSTSTSRLRLQLSSLQRSAHPTSQNSSLPFSNYSINPQQQSSDSQPTRDSSNNLSVQPLSPTLQRRASASDITIGLNRARLPSLAAIQERMSRTKTVETTASASPLPPPSNPNPIVPQTSITTEQVKSAEPAQEVKSSEPIQDQPTKEHLKSTQVLSSISPSLRADLIQSNALDQPSGPSLGTPNPTPTTSVTVPKSIHPLQHSWTLFFDSKATLASAKKAPHTPNPSNPEDSNHPTPTLGAGGQAYQDALQTIGTFQSVEDFCRFFNWTIRPSQMEMHSSVQLFKTGIKPMWEDPANANGGKWTLTMKQPNPPLLDRIWTFLVLGLVGEEVDVLDDVCGAIVATRPRGNRVQVWMREKSNVERVNGLGKRLMKVLEINEESGISLEFSSHSGPNNSASKFISIQGNASPQRSASGSPQLLNYSHSPRSTSGGVSGMLFQRSPSSGTTSSNEMRRTNSLEQQQSPRVPRPPLMMHHSHLGGSLANGMVRPVMNQLNSADVPIQNGIWRPSGPPPPSMTVTPPGLPGNQMGGVSANKIGGVGKSMMMMMMNNSTNGNPTSPRPATSTRSQSAIATMNTP
ncbi:hypothetical protein DFH28DRAFT_928913 [Melampsora americana]|nr:hypothetical protein DFH28DRAFT_928913 [Melampsora americana]